MNAIALTYSSIRFSASSRFKKLNGRIMPLAALQQPTSGNSERIYEYRKYAMNEVLPRYFSVFIRGIATMTISSAIEAMNTLPEQYYLREVPIAADLQDKAVAHLVSNLKRGEQ